MSTSHPILFSAPMVRAILAGTKTQTRRIVKMNDAGQWVCHAVRSCLDPNEAWQRDVMAVECPYGKAGDTLWVKETYDWTPTMAGVFSAADQARMPIGTARIQYRADGGPNHMNGRWVPSIFMPRWASRINLGIIAVRVERLQDITEEDAIAEGIERVDELPMLVRWRNYAYEGPNAAQDNLSDAVTAEPVESYRTLWNTINLPPSPVIKEKKTVAYESYPWSTEDFDAAHPGVRASGQYRGMPITVVPNPWVWVITFKRS